MNKKIMILVSIILLIGVLLFGYTLINKNKEKVNLSDKKILIVYYSAQSHTKEVAEKLAKKLGNVDIFELEVKDKYSEEDLDWTNSNSRVSREHKNESLQDVELVKTDIDNFDSYDTIFIGYPIWWGIAAWPINSFVRSSDFSGKTIIPFCTSASSRLGDSAKLLQKEANSGKWLDGYRFNSYATEEDIDKFLNNLK